MKRLNELIKKKDLSLCFAYFLQVPVEVLQHLTENKKIYKIILQNYPNLLQFRSVSDRGLNMIPPSEGATVGTRVPIKFSMKLKKEVPESTKVFDLEYDLFNEEDEIKEPTKKTEKYKTESGARTTKVLLAKKKNPLAQHAYLRNMRFRKNSICYKGALLNLHKYKMKASSCPDIFRNSMAVLPEDEEPVSALKITLPLIYP